MNNANNTVTPSLTSMSCVCSTPRRFGKTFRYDAHTWSPLRAQPSHALSVKRIPAVKEGATDSVSTIVYVHSIGIFAACLALTMKCEIGASSALVQYSSPVPCPHEKPCCSAQADAIELLCSRVAVVFSPARRASRKLLERMVEFIRLLGHEPIEYNQGTDCRMPYHVCAI